MACQRRTIAEERFCSFAGCNSMLTFSSLLHSHIVSSFCIAQSAAGQSLFAVRHHTTDCKLPHAELWSYTVPSAYLISDTTVCPSPALQTLHQAQCLSQSPCLHRNYSVHVAIMYTHQVLYLWTLIALSFVPSLAYPVQRHVEAKLARRSDSLESAHPGIGLSALPDDTTHNSRDKRNPSKRAKGSSGRSGLAAGH